MTIDGASRLSLRRTAGAICALALGGIGLGGCSMFSSSTADPASCPKLSIAGDLARVVEFQGGRRSVADMATTGQIRSFEGSCSFDDTGVTIEARVTLFGELGPAGQTRNHTYTYFVAITDPSETIITEQQFTSPITFPPGNPRAGSGEDLVLRIPLPKAKEKKASDYRVIVGFRLTPDQLDYNRKQRGS